MFLRLLGQKGMTLPEVVIALGLVGGVSLVTMKLVQQQSENERRIRSNVEISKTLGIVQAAISNVNTCSKMFNGVLPTAGGTVMDSLLVKRSDTEYQVLLEEDKNYGTFYLDEDDIKVYLINAGAEGETSSVELSITFRFKMSGLLDRSEEERLPLAVTLDSTGRISTCGPVLSDANIAARRKFCTDLDPLEAGDADLQEEAGRGLVYWDAATNRCIVNQNKMDCPWGHIPKAMTSIGAIHCVPLEEALNDTMLNQMFDETPCTVGPGGVVIEGNSATDKIRVRCL